MRKVKKLGKLNNIFRHISATGKIGLRIKLCFTLFTLRLKKNKNHKVFGV